MLFWVSSSWLGFIHVVPGLVLHGIPAFFVVQKLIHVFIAARAFYVPVRVRDLYCIFKFMGPVFVLALWLFVSSCT